MKVVIFAGGMGSRLGDEAGVIPKPMVPIGDRPILWHIMSIYAHYGYRDFVICLGHRGDVIKRYFRDLYLLHNDLTIEVSRRDSLTCHTDCVHERDWKVTLVDTGPASLKGARLKMVERYVTDTFFLTYGDGVTDVDISALIEFHRRKNVMATLTAVQPPGRFGAFNLERQEAKISTFKEKPQGDGAWINGGFFVLEPGVMDYIEGDATVWEREPMERLAQEGQLGAFRHKGFWQPMDTLRDKMLLEELWRLGNAPWKVWE